MGRKLDFWNMTSNGIFLVSSRRSFGYQNFSIYRNFFRSRILTFLWPYTVCITLHHVPKGSYLETEECTDNDENCKCNENTIPDPICLCDVGYKKDGESCKGKYNWNWNTNRSDFFVWKMKKNIQWKKWNFESFTYILKIFWRIWTKNKEI